MNTQGSSLALAILVQRYLSPGKRVNTLYINKVHIYLVFTRMLGGLPYLCTLYLHACQVRVAVGDSGFCCCTCVTYFEHI